VLDLHQAVRDLGHLELEQRPDELRRAPRHDDRRALRLVRDVGDDRLDALAVVIALAVHLLAARQQRLDPLAELHERVARVGLLDDAGDQLAHAVLVLVEHHVALRLADALQDHLLRRLRGDAAEVLGSDVALLDLVAVLHEPLLVDLRRLGVDHLARLRVDGRLPGLLLDLVEELLLQVRRKQQLVHAEVTAAAVHLNARVLRRSGRLLVGRQKRVLQRRHQAVGGDSLLALEDPDGLNYLLGHRSPSSRLLRFISEYGIVRTPVSAAIVTSSSLAPTSSPVKLLWPSRGSRRRTRARRPRKRRKWSGFESGRSGPGEETSSPYSMSRSVRCLVTRSQSARSTPSGWSMNSRSRSGPTFSHAKTSTPGWAVERRCSMSFCREWICIWSQKRWT